jgi:multisubunit Na+/H+ antiporter MnhB subunit
MNKISPYYKAVAGSVVAFLTAISTSLNDGTLTAQDWIGALIALVVGLGVVFAVPNIPNGAGGNSNVDNTPTETKASEAA